MLVSVFMYVEKECQYTSIYIYLKVIEVNNYKDKCFGDISKYMCASINLKTSQFVNILMLQVIQRNFQIIRKPNLIPGKGIVIRIQRDLPREIICICTNHDQYY